MRVAVFGLGYVGTVTAACLAANGHEVWGVDLDVAKVGMIAAGVSPLVEPGISELIASVVAGGSLRATASAAEAIAGAQVSLVCVGTPSTANGGTNLHQVSRVIEDIAAALAGSASPHPGMHVVVVRSTVPPGTVEEIGARLQAAVADTGVEVGVAMCPEFLREGSAISDFYAPPYTVIGAGSERVADLVEELFAFIDRPVRRGAVRTAEALKYACNAFHATKVSFANEMGRVLRELDVDSREVMTLFCEDEQLNISPRYLRPGFAFGGSCLAKDLRSLLHLARMKGVDLPLLAGTLATNTLSVRDIVDRVVGGVGRTVALLGLSFKADSDDLRESPYVELAEILLGKGFEVRIYDPIINPSELVGSNRDYVEAKLPHLRRILTASPTEALAGADVAIVSSSTAEVVEALLESVSVRVIDLDGRLGAPVEQRAVYEGACW